MFANYLSSINGVSIYPVITLVVFVVLFLVVTIWTIRVDKNYINHMENIPLDQQDYLSTNFENKNETH